MTNRDEEKPGGENERKPIATQREKELAEAEEIRERGTLTPESGKGGVSSHLPAEETAFMYRTEDEDKKDDSEKKRKSL